MRAEGWELLDTWWDHLEAPEAFVTLVERTYLRLRAQLKWVRGGGSEGGGRYAAAPMSVIVRVADDPATRDGVRRKCAVEGKTLGEVLDGVEAAHPGLPPSQLRRRRHPAAGSRTCSSLTTTSAPSRGSTPVPDGETVSTIRHGRRRLTPADPVARRAPRVWNARARSRAGGGPQHAARRTRSSTVLHDPTASTRRADVGIPSNVSGGTSRY